MIKKYFSFIYVVLFVALIPSGAALACESCMISRLGKEGAMRSESSDKKWFVEYLFEQKNYDRMDAREAHNLHHDGHDVHDKTTEDFHHMNLGRKVGDDLSVSLEIPYIIRRSLEVDSHSIIGAKQRSEGLGDLTLMGDYRFWKSGHQSLTAVGGIKLPTGYVGERNAIGVKFESELQPGTGSVDYILGGVYKTSVDQLGLSSNLSYAINTEGAYDHKMGDLLTASIYADYLINPQWKNYQTRMGIDTVYHYQQREQQYRQKKPDSGGQTVLVGPAFSIQTMPGVSVYSNILFPAYQDLGGVHQQLDYTWTAGGKLQW